MLRKSNFIRRIHRKIKTGKLSKGKWNLITKVKIRRKKLKRIRNNKGKINKKINKINFEWFSVQNRVRYYKRIKILIKNF